MNITKGIPFDQRKRIDNARSQLRSSSAQGFGARRVLDGWRSCDGVEVANKDHLRIDPRHQASSC